MAEGRYQKFLGVSSDVPAPDYYQLLGLERGWIDPGKISTTMAQRLDFLQSASGPGDRELVEYFRRELQRARAMLMDPSRRSEYDEQQRVKRLAELRLYVARLLENNTLSAAAEQATLGRMVQLGVEETDARIAITDEIENLGASRGDGDVDEGALAAADARVLDAMAAIADELIDKAMKGPMVSSGAIGRGAPVTAAAAAPAKRETSMRRAPAPVPVPASEPAPEPEAPVAEAEPAPPPKKRETAVRKPTSEFVRATPVRAATPAPPKRPTQVAKPPTAQMPSDEAKWAVQVTELNEKLAVLERTKAILTQEVGRTEPARRKSRRIIRFLVTLLGVALAFIVGDVIACVQPGLASTLDQQTMELQRQIDEQQPSVVVGSVIGGFLLLFGLVWWLAGGQGRMGYLIPGSVLAVVGFTLGLLPVGHEDRVEKEKASLLEKVGQLPGERDEARKRADTLQEKLTTLEAADKKLIAEQKADFEKRVEDLGKQIVTKDEELKKAVGERDELRGMIVTQADLKKQITDRDKQIGELTEMIKGLQTEVADLKKKLSEKKP